MILQKKMKFYLKHQRLVEIKLTEWTRWYDSRALYNSKLI